MVTIAVLASFNMDLVMRAQRRPGAGETLQGDFAMYLGGKGFNQAVAARRLGASVIVAGRVGDDDFGRRFLDALDREHIDRGAVAVDGETGTGVASIIVEPDGGNSIVQAPRANRSLDAAGAARCWDGAAPVAVAMLQLETSMAAATAFARAARDRGTCVLLNPAPATSVPEELLRLTDILVPNAIEAEALTGAPVRTVDDALAAADALRERGPRTVVITLGERGAVAVAPDLRLHVPAFDAGVLDTVGAGDAFCAALAVSIAEGASLADAVRFANGAGALATTRAGAEPAMPRRDEVDALLAKGAPHGIRP